MSACKHLFELKPLCNWKIACKGCSNIGWWILVGFSQNCPRSAKSGGKETIRTKWQERNIMKQDTRSSPQLVSKLSPEMLTDLEFFAVLGKPGNSYAVKEQQKCCCGKKPILQVIPSHSKNSVTRWFSHVAFSVHLIPTGEINLYLRKTLEKEGQQSTVAMLLHFS